MIASQAGTGDHGEWAEVTNTRSCAINLNGLYAQLPHGQGTTTATVTSDLWLPPHSAFLVADSSNAALNHDLQATIVAWGTGTSSDVLKNSGNTIALFTASATIDTLTYTATSKLVEGASMAFLEPLRPEPADRLSQLAGVPRFVDAGLLRNPWSAQRRRGLRDRAADRPHLRRFPVRHASDAIAAARSAGSSVSLTHEAARRGCQGHRDRARLAGVAVYKCSYYVVLRDGEEFLPPEHVARNERSAHRDRGARGALRADRMLEDLKRAGLKMTPQRIAIVRLFAADESHPTAQDLYERLRAEFPSMSFATVYNTLDALATAGLSRTIRLGNAARFDPNTAPHHHAVCDGCGAVRDLPARSLASSSAARRRIARAAPGFQVRAVERTYRGLCSSCATRAEASASAEPPLARSIR